MAKQRTSLGDYSSDPLNVNRQVVTRYRENAGAVDGFGGPQRMLLLTTTGARTGEPRTTPMMYKTDGDRLVVFASNMGAPKHPAWYQNLVANPDVTVEVGSDRYRARALVTSGPERERLWKLFPFPEHQVSAGSRQIPVVALERHD